METKKTYTLQPVYKKSTCEEQDWCNTLSTGETIMVKVSNVYRWGTFTIELTDKERDELLELEEVKLDDYEHELIEMWDGGCDFWIDVVDRENYTKEQILLFIAVHFTFVLSGVLLAYMDSLTAKTKSKIK